MDMEEELIAQRDAAIAVTKELQKQLQELRGSLEHKFERRALNAERLRMHAETELKRVRDERDWKLKMYNRVLYLSLFAGMIGAIVGWCFGLQVFLLFGQPLVGFLMILPGMAIGSLLGLAIAKTKVQLENRRRDAKKTRISLHTEVELAMNSSMDANDTPLCSLEGMVPGMVDDELREVSRHAAAIAGNDNDDEQHDAAAKAKSRSLVSTAMGLAWQTLHLSKDIALSLYYTKEPIVPTLLVHVCSPLSCGYPKCHCLRVHPVRALLARSTSDGKPNERHAASAFTYGDHKNTFASHSDTVGNAMVFGSREWTLWIHFVTCSSRRHVVRVFAEKAQQERERERESVKGGSAWMGFFLPPVGRA
ncbi:hypothetical protein FI667_g7600, partial [Globisporangium splendens]